VVNCSSLNQKNKHAMTTIQICLLQWDSYNRRMLKMLNTVSEENFNTPVIPGGNSPSWLFGHLADTDDALLPLLGIGERIHPELAKIYLHERGSNQSGHLTRQELIAKWTDIVKALDDHFKSLSENDWLQRHTAASEEDFKKEPQRNKLNVLLSRVTHKASHLGQITLQK
jgi:uncharacterized damage-inducible protein DinB